MKGGAEKKLRGDSVRLSPSHIIGQGGLCASGDLPSRVLFALFYIFTSKIVSKNKHKHPPTSYGFGLLHRRSDAYPHPSSFVLYSITRRDGDDITFSEPREVSRKTNISTLPRATDTFSEPREVSKRRLPALFIVSSPTPVCGDDIALSESTECRSFSPARTFIVFYSTIRLDNDITLSEAREWPSGRASPHPSSPFRLPPPFAATILRCQSQ